MSLVPPTCPHCQERLGMAIMPPRGTGSYSARVNVCHRCGGYSLWCEDGLRLPTLLEALAMQCSATLRALRTLLAKGSSARSA